MSIEKDKTEFLPQTYILSQNYPNPFNPSTTIFLYLPENGDIELDIYSVLGRKVKTLAIGYYAKGSYNFDWNGRNDRGITLSSGIYIYTLKTPNNILSKKMVLLR
jgi:flagellar hook assembly protein FlgD